MGGLRPVISGRCQWAKSYLARRRNAEDNWWQCERMEFRNATKTKLKMSNSSFWGNSRQVLWLQYLCWRSLSLQSTDPLQKQNEAKESSFPLAFEATCSTDHFHLSWLITDTCFILLHDPYCFVLLRFSCMLYGDALE